MEGLRSSVCNAAINAPVEFGGLGYTSLVSLGPQIFTSSFLKRFLFGDPQVRSVTSLAWFKECSRLSDTDHPTASIVVSPFYSAN